MRITAWRSLAKARTVSSPGATPSSAAKFSTAIPREVRTQSTRSWTISAQADRMLPNSGSISTASFVHIRYFAVRDKQGRYLGTVELTQGVAPFRELQSERRLQQYS